MKIEKLSGGFIVLVQGLIFAFSIPFALFICYLFTSKNIALDGKCFLAIILIVMLLMIKQVLSYADIYLMEDKLVTKKIIGVKNRPLSQIKSIDEALLPFSYYILFKDDKKVYFQLKPKDMLKRIVNTDSDQILHSLRSRLIHETGE
jgi:hypothetical protein